MNLNITIKQFTLQKIKKDKKYYFGIVQDNNYELKGVFNFQLIFQKSFIVAS